jgi:hypothetical protein
MGIFYDSYCFFKLEYYEGDLTTEGDMDETCGMHGGKRHACRVLLGGGGVVRKEIAWKAKA